MPKSFRIDPNAKKDYAFDWSEWLRGDTIASYTLAAWGDVTIVSDSRTDTAVTVWVSGVDDGAVGSIVCHVVTAAGREDDRTMVFYGRHE
jgi:hypothetical protein